MQIYSPSAKYRLGHFFTAIPCRFSRLDAVAVRAMSTDGRPSALTFDLKGRCSVSSQVRPVDMSTDKSQTSKARASTLYLPHGPVDLPMFMPVATQASLKGLTPEQLEETGCKLCLNNTYHLGLKPGQAVLDNIGGAHRLQGWDYNILTDSGGLVDCTC